MLHPDLVCKAVTRKAEFGATSASELMLIPLMFLQVVRALIIKADMIAFTVAYSYSPETLSPGRIDVKVPLIPVSLLPIMNFHPPYNQSYSDATHLCCMEFCQQLQG